MNCVIWTKDFGQDINKRPKTLDFVLNQARYAGATILLARKTLAVGLAVNTLRGHWKNMAFAP